MKKKSRKRKSKKKNKKTLRKRSTGSIASSKSLHLIDEQRKQIESAFDESCKRVRAVLTKYAPGDVLRL